MKIIIAYSNTKRQIDGPFNICGSRDDLKLLADRIYAEIDDLGYGWIQIPSEPYQESIANTEPIDWEASGEVK